MEKHAALIIYGDLVLGNGATLLLEGDVIVKGNIILKNGATITGAGSLTYQNDLTINNKASIASSIDLKKETVTSILNPEGIYVPENASISLYTLTGTMIASWTSKESKQLEVKDFPQNIHDQIVMVNVTTSEKTYSKKYYIQ